MWLLSALFLVLTLGATAVNHWMVTDDSIITPQVRGVRRCHGSHAQESPPFAPHYNLGPQLLEFLNYPDKIREHR